MVKPIFTAIMIDLSKYLNSKYPGEKFAVMMDNCPSHSLLTDLPHENIEMVMLPPNCTVLGLKKATRIELQYLIKYLYREYQYLWLSSLLGYLQPLDLLYNAVYKLQFKLRIEDYLLDCHFNNEKLGVTDEKGAYVATDIYYNMSKNIIQAHGLLKKKNANLKGLNL